MASPVTATGEPARGAAGRPGGQAPAPPPPGALHYGTNPYATGTPGELEAALRGRAKVMVLEPGKPTPL